MGDAKGETTPSGTLEVAVIHNSKKQEIKLNPIQKLLKWLSGE